MSHTRRQLKSLGHINPITEDSIEVIPIVTGNNIKRKIRRKKREKEDTTGLFRITEGEKNKQTIKLGRIVGIESGMLKSGYENE